MKDLIDLISNPRDFIRMFSSIRIEEMITY